MFYFKVLNYKSSTSIDLVRVDEFVNFGTNKRYYSNRYLSVIHDENEDYVTISDTKPACDRLELSKLIEMWVVLAFETNKRNTNIDHISNEKHIYNL
jgi:hypothetical protein